FANLKVLADMDAGMGHLHYAYLDYIALQTNPFTSTDEYLAGWMALKQVFRKPAAAAKSPAVQASGSVDSIIPVGSIINRGDGYQYRTDADLKIQADGFGIVAVTAI
ncbi:baseplate J/gp47 family protein, partial [Enterobacter roggenkampii]